MKNVADNMLLNRPALFDWLVLVISLTLGLIFPSIGSFVLSPAFSWWMLIVLLAYIAGAWLKHIPLSYRLTTSHSAKGSPFVIFLISGHWCIFLLVIFFAEPAFSQLTGLTAWIGKDPGSGKIVFPAMILATFITWLVYRSKVLPRSFKSKPANYLFYRELIADLLLTSAVSVLSFLLWEKGVMAFFSTRPIYTFSEVLFVFMFLSITYLICYLPLRFLFHIEERDSRQGWRRLLVIFTFLLLRSTLEILGSW